MIADDGGSDVVVIQAAVAQNSGLRRHRWLPGIRLVRLKPARRGQVVNAQAGKLALQSQIEPD